MAMAWWPVLATLVVHFGVLSNGFLSDDFVHLYNVSNLPFLDAISLSTGGHLLYSYTTVVWLLKLLFGLNPLVFFLLGLMLHLASVRLLFEIIYRLTDKASLAAFGAALWGMCPIAAGSLGWISVHGQVYATAAILWVLLDTVRCSQTPSLLKNSVLLRHVFLLLVAATSFGAGLSSTVVYVLVIALWNPVPGERTRLVVVYGGIALAAIALYVFTMTLQTDAYGDAYSKVDLLKHSLEDITGTLGLFAGLLSIGSSALFLGPLLIGKIALVPVAALPSVAIAITLFTLLPLLIAGYILSTAAQRRQVFALLLLPCAAYGLIAVARNTIIYKALAGTARFHYFPQAMLAIVLCLLLARLIDRLPANAQKYGRMSFIAWLLLAVFPFAIGQVVEPSKLFVNGQYSQYERSMSELKAAIENPAGQGDIVIVNKPYNVFIWGYTPVEFPGLAALFVLSYPSNVVDGRRVVFLEPSKDIVDMTKAHKGSRIAELLVYQPTPSK
jgi:hypothetical protein